MKPFRFAAVAAMGLAYVLVTSVSMSVAQPAEGAAVKQTVLSIFAHIDAYEIGELEKCLSPNVEVFDTSYPLRMDGLGAFADYLEDQQETVRDMKTAVRQPSVRVLGSAAMVNFYFTQDYLVVDEGLSVEETFALRNRRMGRATVVLVKSGNGWLAETIHLSEFSE